MSFAWSKKGYNALIRGNTTEALLHYLKAADRIDISLFKANIDHCLKKLGIYTHNQPVPTHIDFTLCRYNTEKQHLLHLDEIASLSIKLNLPHVFHWCSDTAFELDINFRFSFETTAINTYRNDLRSLRLIAELRAHEKLNYHDPNGPILYIVHQSLPFTHNGYTSRSDGIINGIRTNGINVRCLTRPGFPVDIVRNLKPPVPEKSVINGSEYTHTSSPRRFGPQRSIEYISDSANIILSWIKEVRPSAIIAASNYVTALPSLIAAKQANIPAAYEVRGFWEITELTKQGGSLDSFNYIIKKYIETKTVIGFDKVFTLSNTMKNELIGRGVNEQKIDLIRNGFTPSALTPKSKNTQLLQALEIDAGSCVIGYIGSFVDYEGLDDLGDACIHILKNSDIKIYLVLVGEERVDPKGNRPITSSIIRKYHEHGFERFLKLPGRVALSDVPRWYSAFDICPFPRKPYYVCEVVTPLKPMEAMAMGKCVLVSSCDALLEQVEDGKNGAVFTKGDISDLIQKLYYLAVNPEVRDKLGRMAQELVSIDKSWHSVTIPVKLWIESLQI